jgi:hypothetical protein
MKISLTAACAQMANLQHLVQHLCAELRKVKAEKFEAANCPNQSTATVRDYTEILSHRVALRESMVANARAELADLTPQFAHVLQQFPAANDAFF